MRAKSVFRYSEPSVVGGFIAVDVDEEMLNESQTQPMTWNLI